MHLPRVVNYYAPVESERRSERSARDQDVPPARIWVMSKAGYNSESDTSSEVAKSTNASTYGVCTVGFARSAYNRPILTEHGPRFALITTVHNIVCECVLCYRL